jgi:hypothetical protein
MVGRGQEVHHDAIDHESPEAGEYEGRPGELHLGQASRAQHDHLAVHDQSVIDEEDRAEGRDRQKEPNQGRQSQTYEAQKHRDRQPPVHDEINPTQRVDQPNDYRQARRDGERRDQELVKDIERNDFHSRPI